MENDAGVLFFNEVRREINKCLQSSGYRFPIALAQDLLSELVDYKQIVDRFGQLSVENYKLKKKNAELESRIKDGIKTFNEIKVIAGGE